MSLLVQPLAEYQSIILFCVRLVMGLVMIYFGWPKIKDLKQNAEDFVKMGFKPGWLWGTPVALLEFFGGIFLIVGFFVPIWAAGMVVHMTTGAIWKSAKTDKGFSDWSYDLLLLVSALVLLAFGQGSISLMY